jgi:hypothetical protein
MPIKPTYPGLYIEELPATSFSINPAPTSVTVLIGYAHPFRTPKANFGRALPLASFTEFERAFGGYVASGVFDGNLALAAAQFFLNGGSELYAVGLEPKYNPAGALTDAVRLTDTGVAPVADMAKLMNPRAEFQKAAGGNKLVAVGLEPADKPDLPLTVEFSPKATKTVADIRATYGSRVETFRDVTLTDAEIVEKVNKVSALIRLKPGAAGAWPTDFDFSPAGNGKPFAAALAQLKAPDGTSVLTPSDFTDAFKDDTDLDKIDVFNLMATPGVSVSSVVGPALAFCERKLAFFVMDPPPPASAEPPPADIESQMTGGAIEKSTNGAIYFPALRSLHPVTGDPIDLPPSGTVAGVYARTDTQFGVWKAPAGVDAGVRGSSGVVEGGRLTDMRHGRLNKVGVNALRSFPGVGTVVFGARTLHGGDADTAYQQWKYVPVRRTALFIEQTLKANLTWVVFRPNDEPLWAAIRATIGNFMLSLFRQGALQGASPSQAFRVKCDDETTTPDDVANGRVNIVVAFAPLKPAEFVVIQIAQLAGQSAA